MVLEGSLLAYSSHFDRWFPGIKERSLKTERNTIKIREFEANMHVVDLSLVGTLSFDECTSKSLTRLNADFSGWAHKVQRLIGWITVQSVHHICRPFVNKLFALSLHVIRKYAFGAAKQL